MKVIKVKVLGVNGEEERFEIWTLEQVLNEINRDRSEGWTDYNESDWEDGWNEWVEGEFYSLVESVNLPKHIVNSLNDIEKVKSGIDEELNVTLFDDKFNELVMVKDKLNQCIEDLKRIYIK